MENIQEQPDFLEQEEINKLHPLYLLKQEMKDKALKKPALQSLVTISIALGRKRTRQQLIPYLGQIFISENLEIKKLILKGLTNLLHPIYIGKSHHSCLVLELVMDILCVYSEPQIRIDAYQCLNKVFAFMDVRKTQNILVKALNKLNEQGKERNIRDLIIRIIPCIYAGVDADNESQLLKILNSFKENIEDQRLLAEVLPQLIKGMPPAPETQIRSIIQVLLETKDRNILSDLIVPIVLLAKVSGEETTTNYIKCILSQDDPYVISIAFKKFQQLNQVFSQNTLTPLMQRIAEYDSQAQEVKNAILQMFENLPISADDQQKICQPPSSLQLKNTLTDTLCRIQYKQPLVKLFNSADPTFQAKMFPKLPPVSELHIEILQKVMNGKSWRQKLTVLENINARTKNGQNTQILLMKLCQFMGDKIASVRTSVCTTISSIMVARQVSLKEIKNQLHKRLASKNWFERQSVFRVLQELVTKQYKFQKSLINQFCQAAKSEVVTNIKTMVQEIEEKIK